VTVCGEQALLGESDGPAVVTENAGGASPFLIVCDHASNRIPAALGSLGLETEALDSHAAWDPGAYGLASELARRLDAPLVAAGFSRLVYDVNRPLDSPEVTRAASEVYAVPGNRDLSEAERERRANALYRPFHDRIDEIIEARTANGQSTALISIHSFTPVYHGAARSMELGVLHDHDARLANAVLECAARFTALNTERNRPYGPQDGVTHTIAKHALPRGLLNVMIEVRNDLIRGPEAQADMADMLARLLSHALDAAEAAGNRPDQPGGANARSD